MLKILSFALGFYIKTIGCPAPDGYLCPSNISIGWYETPPYVIYNSSDKSVGGFLIDILEKGIQSCCLNNVTYHYIEKTMDYTTLVDLSLQSSLDLVVPIRNSPKKNKFLAFPFVNLVESPGAVLYNTKTSTTSDIIKSTILSTLPLVVLLLLWVCIFGITFWIVEIIPEKSGCDRNFSDMMAEIFQGIWWSFITLATVGYGDILPRRVASRILCYVWLLCSSVAMAAYTATVTSVLIQECFSNTLEVKGSKIAIVNGSNEHKLVVKKNGYAEVYPTTDKFLEVLKHHNELDGCLIELYAASFYQQNFNNFRIQTVFEDVRAYGVVLRSRTAKLQHCMKQHVLGTQREIYENVRKKFPPLKTVITSSESEESSRSLFDPSSGNLRNTLLALSSAIIILCAIGIIREKLFLKKTDLSLDKEENFALLHTVKTEHQRKLHEHMACLQKDIMQVQERLQKFVDRLNAQKDSSNNFNERKRVTFDH